jgi:hypothetical protein
MQPVIPNMTESYGSQVGPQTQEFQCRSFATSHP